MEKKEHPVAPWVLAGSIGWVGRWETEPLSTCPVHGEAGRFPVLTCLACFYSLVFQGFADNHSNWQSDHPVTTLSNAMLSCVLCLNVFARLEMALSMSLCKGLGDLTNMWHPLIRPCFFCQVFGRPSWCERDSWIACFSPKQGISDEVFVTDVTCSNWGRCGSLKADVLSNFCWVLLSRFSWSKFWIMLISLACFWNVDTCYCIILYVFLCFWVLYGFVIFDIFARNGFHDFSCFQCTVYRHNIDIDIALM